MKNENIPAEVKSKSLKEARDEINDILSDFDDEIAILTRGGKYYGLNHRDMHKAALRDYANDESIIYTTEENEDGGLDFYYDDDSWEVDCEVIEGYAKMYVNKQFNIADDGDSVEYGDGQIFKIIDGDNGWMEMVKALLK